MRRALLIWIAADLIYSLGAVSQVIDCSTVAQGVESKKKSLPSAFKFSNDSTRLTIGMENRKGLYDINSIAQIDLTFSSTDWKTVLSDTFGRTETGLEAKFAYNGEVLPEKVGVRYKGMTSYNANHTEKKSFKIYLDAFDSKQDLEGQSTLNLNCGFSDNSFMREVLYAGNNQRYIPSVGSNYVELYINGEYWGIYINSQPIGSDYIKDWFLSKRGTRWRATSPRGGGIMPRMDNAMRQNMDSIMRLSSDEREKMFTHRNASGEQQNREGSGMFHIQGFRDSTTENLMEGFGAPGGGFGTGKSSLNYLGNDSSEYAKYYTLKKTYKENPWEDLINTVRILNNEGQALTDSLEQVLDIDRALWFLACENCYQDEDGYISKGGMDYYVYWDAETGLLTPLEYDGNESFPSNEGRGPGGLGGFPGNFQGRDSIRMQRMKQMEGRMQGTMAMRIQRMQNDSVMQNKRGVRGMMPPMGGGSWTPFRNSDNTNFPLISKLLNVPEWRQRYLAHYRTLLKETFNPTVLNEQIEANKQRIQSYIERDPKKLMTDEEFGKEVELLKKYVQSRFDTLMANNEIIRKGVAMENAKWSVDVLKGEAIIMVDLNKDNSNLKKVNLFIGKSVAGGYTKVAMADNGSEGDKKKGDGIYTIKLTGLNSGERIRFYFESIASDEAETRCYLPARASHDCYTFCIL